MIASLVFGLIIIVGSQEPAMLSRKGTYAEITPTVKSLILEFERAQNSGDYQTEQRIARENQPLIGKSGHYEFDAHLCRQMYVIDQYGGRHREALAWGRRGVTYAVQGEYDRLTRWLKRATLIEAFRVDFPTDSEWATFMPIVDSLETGDEASKEGRKQQIFELMLGFSFFCSERAGFLQIPKHQISQATELWRALSKKAQANTLSREAIVRHMFVGTSFSALFADEELAGDTALLAFSLPVNKDYLFEAIAALMAISGLFPDLSESLYFEVEPLLLKVDPKLESDAAIMMVMAQVMINYSRGQKEEAQKYLDIAQKKLRPESGDPIKRAVTSTNALFTLGIGPGAPTTSALAEQCLSLFELLHQSKYQEVIDRGQQALKEDRATGFFRLVIMDIIVEARNGLKERGPEFIEAVRECRAEYLKRWSSRFVPQRPIGIAQNLTSNPMSRFGLNLATNGYAEEGLATVEAGRSWGVLAAVLRNQSKKSLVDQLVALPDVKSIRARSQQSRGQTVQISYVITKDRKPAAFVVTADKVHFVELSVTYDQLQRHVNTWRKELVAIAARGPSVAEQNASRLVTKLIFDPFAKLPGFSNARRILVVPDGPVGSLPFIALTDASGKRLVDKYSVVLRPTLRAIESLQSDGSTAMQRGFIVPNFTAAKSSTALAEFKALDPLQPRTIQIAKQTKAKLVESSMKSAGALEQAMRGLDIAHIVTHGVADPNRFMDSYLLIGMNPNGPTKATVGQICNFKLEADFVGLWACHTAEGEVQGGDGNIGLAWAFFNAGARSLVASKWAVDQTAVASLLEDFDLRVRTRGMSYEEAIRTAILKLKSNKSAPGFWAAFEYYSFDQGAK